MLRKQEVWSRARCYWSAYWGGRSGATLTTEHFWTWTSTQRRRKWCAWVLKRSAIRWVTRKVREEESAELRL